MSQKPAIIIDDEIFILGLLSTLLTKLGYKVVGEAENGRDGVNLCKEHTPDLVICDIRMPVMSGTDALKQILRNDPNTVVIMNTIVDDTFVAESCMELGAKDYLTKGLEPDELLVKLDETISKYI